MNQARPWLPKDVLRGARAAKPFAGAIQGWSDRWFPGGRGWRAAGSFDPAYLAGWSVLRQQSEFELLGRPKAMLELGFALLGQAPRQNLTESDTRLLRRLAAKALDDLATSLEAVLPPPSGGASAQGGEAWQLTIGTGNQSWLALALSPAIIAAVARNGFPAKRAKSPLDAPLDTVADVRVTMAGRIGSARLSIEQIDTLAVGDILLLDQHMGEPAELAVAGQPSGLFFAIANTDDRITLIMQD